MWHSTSLSTSRLILALLSLVGLTQLTQAQPFPPQIIDPYNAVDQFCLDEAFKNASSAPNPRPPQCTANDVRSIRYLVLGAQQVCTEGELYLLTDLQLQIEVGPNMNDLGFFTNLEGNFARNDTEPNCFRSVIHYQNENQNNNLLSRVEPLTTDITQVDFQNGIGPFLDQPDANGNGSDGDVCGDVPSVNEVRTEVPMANQPNFTNSNNNYLFLFNFPELEIRCQDLLGNGYASLSTCLAWTQNQRDDCTGWQDSIPDPTSKCYCMTLEESQLFGLSVVSASPTKAPTTSPTKAPTTSPVATTAAPVATTSAPVAGTSAPVATTAAPVAGTSAPVATTAAPVATTSAPVATFLPTNTPPTGGGDVTGTPTLAPSQCGDEIVVCPIYGRTSRYSTVAEEEKSNRKGGKGYRDVIRYGTAICIYNPGNEEEGNGTKGSKGSAKRDLRIKNYSKSPRKGSSRTGPFYETRCVDPDAPELSFGDDEVVVCNGCCNVEDEGAGYPAYCAPVCGEDPVMCSGKGGKGLKSQSKNGRNMPRLLREKNGLTSRVLRHKGQSQKEPKELVAVCASKGKGGRPQEFDTKCIDPEEDLKYDILSCGCCPGDEDQCEE